MLMMMLNGNEDGHKDNNKDGNDDDDGVDDGVADGFNWLLFVDRSIDSNGL